MTIAIAKVREMTAILDRVLEAYDRAAHVKARDRQLAPLERRMTRALAVAFRTQKNAFLSRLGRIQPLWPVQEASIEYPWEPAFDASEAESGALFKDAIEKGAGEAIRLGSAAAATMLATGSGGAGVGTAVAAGATGPWSRVGLTAVFGADNPRAIEYLSRLGAERVTGISAETRRQMRALLTQSADDHWSYGRTAIEIRNRFDGFAASRAETIARTEIANAHEFGNLMVGQALQTAGLAMEKGWIAESDACAICVPNEAVGWIPLDDAFPSGDDSPPAHPSCRCAVQMRRVGSDE